MSKNTAAQNIAISLNASLKKTITAEEMIKIFKKEIDWRPWTDHLTVFFDELPAVMLYRFIKENGFSFEQISDIYNSLPQVWKTKFKQANKQI